MTLVRLGSVTKVPGRSDSIKWSRRTRRPAFSTKTSSASKAFGGTDTLLVPRRSCRSEGSRSNSPSTSARPSRRFRSMSSLPRTWSPKATSSRCEEHSRVFTAGRSPASRQLDGRSVRKSDVLLSDCRRPHRAALDAVRRGERDRPTHGAGRRVGLIRYSEIKPRRTARRTASVRFAAPSFPQIEATWNFTV